MGVITRAQAFSRMLCSALPNMSAEAGFSEASDPFYSEDPLAAGSEEEDQTFAALLTAASLPAPTRAASVFHACAGTAGASEVRLQWLPRQAPT